MPSHQSPRHSIIHVSHSCTTPQVAVIVSGLTGVVQGLAYGVSPFDMGNQYIIGIDHGECEKEIARQCSLVPWLTTPVQARSIPASVLKASARVTRWS